MGTIPIDVSVAFDQIRAGTTDYNAADWDWPFAEDFSPAGPPVDFR
jgi:hypothetical protein